MEEMNKSVRNPRIVKIRLDDGGVGRVPFKLRSSKEETMTSTRATNEDKTLCFPERYMKNQAVKNSNRDGSCDLRSERRMRSSSMSRINPKVYLEKVIAI